MLDFISEYYLESSLIFISLTFLAISCFYIASIIFNRKTRKLKKYTQEVHHHLEAILAKSKTLQKEVDKDITYYSGYTQKGQAEINRLEDILEDKDLQIQGLNHELNLMRAELNHNHQDKITELERKVFELNKENKNLIDKIDSIKNTFDIPTTTEDSSQAELVEIKELRENKKEEKDLFELFKKMLG